MPQQAKESEWKTTTELCQLLNCSRWHLIHLREQGVLQAKTHWRNISPLAARPTYRYHAERCRKAIEKLQG